MKPESSPIKAASMSLMTTPSVILSSDDAMTTKLLDILDISKPAS